MELETLRLEVADHIARVTLNRPDALNTMNAAFWTDMIEAFAAIEADGSVRAVLLTSTRSAGKELAASCWTGSSDRVRFSTSAARMAI